MTSGGGTGDKLLLEFNKSELHALGACVKTKKKTLTLIIISLIN